MNGHLRIDRDILIVSGIGAISIMGICLVLLISRWPQPQPVSGALQDSTVTPFQYELLATETFTPDPSLVTESPEIVFQEETVAPEFPPTQGAESFETPQSLPTLPGNTGPQATNTLPSGAGNPTATAEDSLDEELVFPLGIFDDTDPRILYDGDWTSELFVDNAHEETLNVSTSTGNTATFYFEGRQLVLGYLGSPDVDLGTATITIDDKSYPLDQANGDTWTSPSPPLSFDLHTVVITHKDGDLLFLDYIDVR